MIRALIAVVVVAAFVLCEDAARGQDRSTYQPRTPTLSPYLDYFRAPQGPLDSYHEYVRPQINLRNTLTQQDRQLRSQARQLRTLNDDWARAQRTGTLAPTGIGASFFNYSHFYPTKR